MVLAEIRPVAGHKLMEILLLLLPSAGHAKPALCVYIYIYLSVLLVLFTK